MKKLISWLLIFIIFSLCGCSATKTTEENTESVSQIESVSEIIEEGKNYKITYNGNFTYSYEIRDNSGTVILSDDNAKKTPHITMIDENTAKLTIQQGTGITTAFTTYCNITNGSISESFNAVFDECNGKTVYYEYRESKYYIIVRDIFDKDVFYKEFEIDDDIYAVADAVASADFSQDGKKLTVTYLAGKDYKETEIVFNIE